MSAEKIGCCRMSSPLERVQAARLEQDAVGDADLADVVQVGGLFDLTDRLLGPAELVAEQDHVGADARGMAQRVVVLGVEGRCQGLEIAEMHALDLVVETRVVDGKGQMRADALQDVAVDRGEIVQLGAGEAEHADELVVVQQRDARADLAGLVTTAVEARRRAALPDDHQLAADGLERRALCGARLARPGPDVVIVGRVDGLEALAAVGQDQLRAFEGDDLAKLLDRRRGDLVELEA